MPADITWPLNPIPGQIYTTPSGKKFIRLGCKWVASCCPTSPIDPDLILNLDAASPSSYNGFGTTWNDLTNYTNNGILTNGPSFDVDGGGNFIFDGIDDYVDGVNLSAISGNGARSIAIWFKTSATYNVPLFDVGGGLPGNDSHQIHLAYFNGVGASPPANNGGIYLTFYNNDLFYPINYTTLFDSEWHFMAYSYSPTSSVIRICFDGIFSNTAYAWTPWITLTSQPFQLNAPLSTIDNPYLIGSSRFSLWGNGSNYFNGSIAVVKVWKKTLTVAEILNEYSSYQSRYI